MTMTTARTPAGAGPPAPRATMRAAATSLLGHALVETTERYAHLSEQSVADAADRGSGRIRAALIASGREREGGAGHADG